jgi:hypothetical protein
LLAVERGIQRIKAHFIWIPYAKIITVQSFLLVDALKPTREPNHIKVVGSLIINNVLIVQDFKALLKGEVSALYVNIIHMRTIILSAYE